MTPGEPSVSTQYAALWAFAWSDATWFLRVGADVKVQAIEAIAEITNLRERLARQQQPRR